MGDDEAILVYASRLRDIMHRRLARRFREHGLTSGQFAVLQALWMFGESSTGRLLEVMLGTGGNIRVVLANLEDRGLIVRRADPADGRVVLVDLTDAGRTLISSIFPDEHAEWLADILAPIPADERADLARALARAIDRLRNAGEH
ncbi:MAG: MarR family transcriptional regulator [Bifidobacterium sp.]|nr:MarR family transcriptional regulator [Bifidobacterium sp.]